MAGWLREDLQDGEREEAAFSDIAALHIPATDGNGVLRHPGATPGHPGIAQDQGGAGGHLFAGLNRWPHPSSPRRARLSDCTCAVGMGCIYIAVRYGRSQCGAREVDLHSCCAAARSGRGLQGGGVSQRLAAQLSPTRSVRRR